MLLGVGKVTQVLDSKKFIIRATIQGLIEDIKCFPLESCDEPEIDEEVILFELESEFGYSYVYKKARLFDYTRFKFNNCIIQLTDSGISIKTDSGRDILVNSNGDIDIKSEGNITIQAKSKLKIKSDSEIEFDSNKITFPNRKVPPTGSGPLNAISVCPFTGAPHSGNTII